MKFLLLLPLISLAWFYIQFTRVTLRQHGQARVWRRAVERAFERVGEL